MNRIQQNEYLQRKEVLELRIENRLMLLWYSIFTYVKNNVCSKYVFMHEEKLETLMGWLILTFSHQNKETLHISPFLHIQWELQDILATKMHITIIFFPKARKDYNEFKTFEIVIPDLCNNFLPTFFIMVSDFFSN